MDKYKPTLKRYYRIAQLSLFLFCLSTFFVDVFLGDGDGIIDQLNLNPLSFFIWSQLFLILIKGIMDSNKWISNSCLSLSVIILGLIGLNALMDTLPVFSNFGAKTIVAADSEYPFTSFDTVYFKNFRPNTRFIKENYKEDGGKAISVRINNEGVRGEPIVKKKSDEHRIILLGDSFMQALQVDEEEMIGHQLAKLLPDTASIIQHGFSSWSPLLEFNWLLRKGMSFEPDEVMLFLFVNDFFSGHRVSDQFYAKYTNFDKNNYPTSFSFEEQVSPKRNIFNHFVNSLKSIRLVSFLSFHKRSWLSIRSLPANEVKEKLSCSADQFATERAAKIVNKDPLIDYYWDLVAVFRDTSIWDTNTAERVNLSLGYLKSMADYLEGQNIGFSIKFIPMAPQFKGENLLGSNTTYFNGQLLPNTGISQRLNAFCKQNDIRFLDLYHPFKDHKEKSPEKLLYFNIDGHWNDQGHKLAAEAIAKKWYLDQNTVQ